MCILVISFTAGKKTDVPVHNFRINTRLWSYCEMIIWITFLLLTAWPGVWHIRMIIFNSRKLLSIIRWSSHKRRGVTMVCYSKKVGDYRSVQHSMVTAIYVYLLCFLLQFYSSSCTCRPARSWQFFGLSRYHSSSRRGMGWRFYRVPGWYVAICLEYFGHLNNVHKLSLACTDSDSQTWGWFRLLRLSFQRGLDSKSE